MSTTICQLIDSPIPVPLPIDFVVKKWVKYPPPHFLTNSHPASGCEAIAI
ncbi:MAG: hypothetical protein WBL95_14410 [Microcoleus sp.]